MDYGSWKSPKTWLAHSPIWAPIVVSVAYTLMDPTTPFKIMAAAAEGQHLDFAPMVFFNGVLLTALGGAYKRVYVFQFGNALALMGALPAFLWITSLTNAWPGALLVGIMATGAFFSWAAVSAMFDFNVECARGEHDA